MEVALLSLIGLVFAMLLLGVCVCASEQRETMRTEDKGDAYRIRSESTRQKLEQARKGR